MYRCRLYMYFVFLSVSIIVCSGCGEQETFVYSASDACEHTVTPVPGAGMAGESGQEAESVFVYVCGAVKFPGVYELPAGSRVYQAIDAAGGVTKDAFPEGINQALVLRDEDRIFVPDSNETETGSSVGAVDTEENGKINLNTATAEELMTLSGIGASRADAILKYREEHGAFSSTEEIMNVQGIKEGTYSKIKDEIVVR